jgi:hypothetical protein
MPTVFLFFFEEKNLPYLLRQFLFFPDPCANVQGERVCTLKRGKKRKKTLKMKKREGKKRKKEKPESHHTGCLTLSLEPRSWATHLRFFFNFFY